MNILYITDAMNTGGVQKCILQLSKYFADTNKIIVASKYGESVSALDKMNVKHYEILDTNNKSIPSILKNIWIIYKIIKREQINIIHSHHRMTTFYAKLISKFVNVRVIHTQHLCIEDKYALTKSTLQDIEVITVSNGAKDVLVKECGLNEKKITTIYNTVETECENKVVDDILLDLKKSGFFIVAQVSRIVDYKGVYDFVEIAKQTTKENKKVKFVLLGNGPEFMKINSLIKKERLEEKVYLLGSKDNIIEHLKYIDLLLLCSYVEGLPLAPLEAFSQGIPVIATDIDGTNEEIENGVNGYLVNVKDIDEFKNRILNIYNNKDKYLEMKEKCKVIFQEKFNSELYYNSHMNIYNKAIE